MALTGSYRTGFLERDFSGFVLPSLDETGAMVVTSRKGRGDKPLKCTSEQDVIKYFGKPSSTYWNIFEAIAYARMAPIWVISAIGDNSLYGGVDVKETAVSAFGTGRVAPDNFVYTGVNTDGSHTAGTGNGKTAQFSGTITNVPIDEGTIVIKVGTTTLTASDSEGDISGSDINVGGTNTINYTTGAFDFTIDGTVGVSEETDIQCEADSSGSLNNTYWWIFTSTTSYYIWYDVSSGGTDPDPTVPSGAPATKVGIEVDIATDDTANTVASNTQSAIDGNAAFSATVSTDTVTVTHVGAEVVRDAEDGNTGWTSPITVNTQGTDPTGAIPTNGATVTVEFVYNADLSSTVSHSFFTTSPYEDDLAAKITYVSGKKFKMTLYEIVDGVNIDIIDYEYSLEREKDKFGKSLYIFDVFDEDDYLIPVVNSSYTWAAPSFTASIVSFSGGARGDDPAQSHRNTAWDQFKKVNKYPVTTFMDVGGVDQTKLINLRTNYQYYSHIISCVPMGNSVSDSVTFREGLGIDDDHMSLYTNWHKIEDPYNNSFAWVSMVGSIGAKYALMSDVYDALSPAGIDENDHGGQLISWKTIDTEYDYDDTDLETLDNAQINPIIKDDLYGPMAYGDKTLQVDLSDTSFVGTRRLYNKIIKTVIQQVLRRQEFKNNDEAHRLRAKSLTENLLTPILGLQLLREAVVVCDTSNNTDLILDQRKFILDIYVKVTPNSQKVILRLTRLSQTQTTADFL